MERAAVAVDAEECDGLGTISYLVVIILYVVMSTRSLNDFRTPNNAVLVHTHLNKTRAFPQACYS